MRQSIICAVVFLMALALAACGASTQGPTSWLDRPLDGDKVPLEPLTIQAHASDADGVARFEFFVGDTLLAKVPSQGGRFADAQAGWSPSAAGTYTIRARAVDGKSNVGPEAISRIVVGEVVQAPDTPTPAAAQPPTPTYTPSPAPAEPSGGISAAQITFTADRYSLKQGECTMLRWSVQGGFGVELEGQRVERYGQTQVCPQQTTTYRLGADEGEAYKWSTIVIAVERAEQPPTPTYTPTGTPRPPTPTYTPTPTSTPTTPPPPPPPSADIQFWADNDNIPAGSCTTVRWHAANVKAYWVDGRPGAGDNGSFQTCPCQEERHTLHVVKADNSEQDFEVTIRVSGECAAPPPPPPPPPPPQDTEGPSINDIELEKVNCDLYRGYATISDPSGVSWVQFRYKIGGGAWQSVGMSDIGGGYYETNEIGVSGEGIVNIEYYIVASDTPGNQRESGHTTELVGCLE